MSACTRGIFLAEQWHAVLELTCLPLCYSGTALGIDLCKQLVGPHVGVAMR